MLMLGALALGGCGGASEIEEADATRLEAVLSIERMESLSSGEAPTASALAHFVILPDAADADQVMSWAGLRAMVPEETGCVGVAADSSGEAARAAFDSEWGELELLEAGNVSVEAGNDRTALVLHAFPGSGSAAGVLYTTPDRSAPLPADTRYTIDVSGSRDIPPLRVEGYAPQSLADVTLNGTPLAEVWSIGERRAIEVAWQRGEPGDHVQVELTDGNSRVLCSFDDESGKGTLPAVLTATISGADASWFSIRRVREAVVGRELPHGDSDHEPVLETMMSFSFELSSPVRLSQP